MDHKVLYLALLLKKELEIGINGIWLGPDENKEIQLSWADGMIGALPVFDSAESAAAYAGDDVQVILIKRETT